MSTITHSFHVSLLYLFIFLSINKKLNNYLTLCYLFSNWFVSFIYKLICVTYLQIDLYYCFTNWSVLFIYKLICVTYLQIDLYYCFTNWSVLFIYKLIHIIYLQICIIVLQIDLCRCLLNRGWLAHPGAQSRHTTGAGGGMEVYEVGQPSRSRARRLDQTVSRHDSPSPSPTPHVPSDEVHDTLQAHRGLLRSALITERR